HSSHRLSTPRKINAFDVKQYRHISYVTIDQAVLLRRRTNHDFLTSGNTGRNSQHQKSAGQHGRTSRNIQTNTLDSSRFPPAGYPRHRINWRFLMLLRSVECRNISVSQVNSRLLFSAYTRSNLRNLRFLNKELIQFYPIKLLGEGLKSLITPAAYFSDNAFHALADSLVFISISGDQFIDLRGRQVLI